ncbi:MAG: DUF1553 domain-containing protein [Planctomycetota bacterium]
MPPASSILLSWSILVAAAAAQHDGVVTHAPADRIDFARAVQPILAHHCYACHGPDDAKRKADLRLDRRTDAFAERDNGAAFVAGQPAASEAMVRMLSDDPDEHMPPPDSGHELKPAEIETLRRWIEGGAEWTEHWAFVAPQRPSVPTVADAAWPRSDVDRFVLARLEKEGLRPTAEASREAWLRRVTFDLIGLPPTIAELDAFLRDTSADAYDKVVDRLLADERYGERQATEWLDLARYADSNGYQRDRGRTAWKWRDWVIDAFNKNQPFDQFTIEQLAGDLLPEPLIAQRIATGFNRNHPVNTEAGEELDEYRSAYVMDRVHTTATTWLGLSVACAQCHDHKYDPISQRDYYSFYGFFNHIKERDSGGGMSLNPKPAIPAPGPDDVPRLADLDRRIKTLEKHLERDDPLADEAQQAWEKQALERLGAPIPWQTLQPTEFMAKHGSRLQQLEDGSILATGPVPARDTYELVFVPGKRKIQALRLDVLPDPSMPLSASGRADDGRFILSALETRLASTAESSDPPLIAYALAAADLNQKEDEDEHYLTAITPGSIAGSIVLDDGSNNGGDKPGGFRFGGRGWSIAGEGRKEPREAILIPVEPIDANGTSILRLTLHHNSSNKFKSLIGRFRISFTEDERVRAQLLPISPSLWRAIGPFPAAGVDAAYATAFEPEKDLETAEWKKKYDQPIVEVPKVEKPAEKPAAKTDAKKPGAADKEAPAVAKAEGPAKDAAMPARQPAKDGAPPVAETPPAAEGKPPAPDADGKAPGGKSLDGKTPDGKAPDGGAVAKNADAKPAAKPEESEKPAAKAPPKAKPRRLEWKERRDWRDGDSARLSVDGAASAWFVSRKIHTETARTAVIEFEGGVGAKLWLNGSLVAEFAPPPEAPENEQAKAPPMKQEFDEEAFLAQRARERDREPRRLRLGLRAGDNHLAIKLVGKGALPRPKSGGGMATAMNAESADGDDGPPPGFGFPGMMQRGSSQGVSFTFTMNAEGDDLLDFEALQAMRDKAAASATAPTTAPATTSPAAATATAATATEATAPKTPPISSPVSSRVSSPVSAPVNAPVSAPVSAETEADTKKPPTPAERRAKVLRRWFRTRIDIAGRVLFEELERVKKEKERVEGRLTSALVMEELATPRPTHVYVRGDYRHKGDLVATNTPTVLPPMPSDLPKNRLGLARWLVSKDNPLVARVTVNRAWQQFFGLGLVRTADNFGMRGAQPSHPELLDWLATEFVASGWNVKKLHRLLVLSATYRQNSAATPQARERDPDNVLLARGPHQRLSAEMVRDQAMSAAGLLVQKVGGASVKPFQPSGLWKSVLGSGEWKADTGEATYRRGLYVYWKRGVPYPSFTAFDAPKRETCTVTRTLTTTPLQALVLLNDPVYVEAGRALGQRMRKDGGKEDEARLAFGFRLVASRRPDEREGKTLLALLGDLRTHYKADLKAAKLLIEAGTEKADVKADSKPEGKPGDKTDTKTDTKTVDSKPDDKPSEKPSEKPSAKPDADPDLAEAAAWAQIGATLLNLEAAIRRG